MATEYISREAMHKANQDEWQGVYGFVDCDIFEDNENMIDRVPAADVVEVVRCRDCVHLCMTGLETWCFFHPQGSLGHDDFCSAGERRKP